MAEKPTYEELEQRVKGLEHEAAKRKQVQKALQESEENFRSLSESSTDYIMRYDRECRHTYVNAACASVAGISVDKFIGKTHREMGFDKEQYEVWEEKIQQVFETGEPQQWVFEFEGPQGPMYLDWRVVPEFSANGEVMTVLGVSRDITALKQAEEQLKAYANELERKNRELKQLVYVVSHDLQEPLATLSDYMALFARRYKGRIDSDADEYIDRATSLTKRTQRFSHALLKYARTGKLGRQVERTDCEAVLDRALLEFEIQIAKSNAKITHDPLPTVMADGLQLEHLFRNLIGNAIKFRKEEAPRVHISAQQHEAEWTFSVRDNGIGIGPEFAEQVFEFLYRIPSNDEYSGEGIGLAVCRKIVQGHGGRIWVESEPGRGSTFYFTIPSAAE